MHLQLIREKVVKKSTQVHVTRLRASKSKGREQLHVLNTNEIQWRGKHEFVRFCSLLTSGNKVLLATLILEEEFSKLIDMQQKKKATEKGLLGGKTKSSSTKTTKLYIPLDQYAKFKWIPRPPFGLVAWLLYCFFDNLSRISCILCK